MNFYNYNNYKSEFNFNYLNKYKRFYEFLISKKLDELYNSYLINMLNYNLYNFNEFKVNKRKLFINKLRKLRNNYINKNGKLFSLEEINKELE